MDLNAFFVINSYVNLERGGGRGWGRGQGLPTGDPWSVSLNASYHYEQQYIWFRVGI